MKTRLVFGISAAILLVALLFWAPLSLIAAVVLLCSGLAYLEFDKMFFQTGSVGRQAKVISLIALTGYAMWVDLGLGFLFFWGGFIFLGVYHVLTSSKEADFQKTARTLGLELIGYIYVLALLGFMMPIIQSYNGREYLLLMFLIVFVGDTAAYFAGKYFGKRKLAPAISPKKTVEGAIGGVLGAFLVSALWLQIYPDPYDPAFAYKVVLFAPFLSVLAQMGDLFESILKRSQAYKDSGSFIPGHGGILDRIDGVAFAAPTFFVYMIYVLEKGV